MKISLKQAILNKYNIIAFIFIPTVCIISWAISPVCGIINMSGYSLEQMRGVVSFFSYVIWGFSYMQLMLPLLASFVMLPFLREKRMYNFSYVREKSYSTAVLRPMLRQLLIGCTTMFLGYMIFLCAGLMWRIDPRDVLVTSIETGEPSCSRVFMPEIFGEFFAAENMFMYFVVDGFWKYFVFCFIYGLFSVSVSFYTRKDFMCLIIPSVYYIVLDLVFSGIGAIKSGEQTIIDLSLFAPSYPIMSGARDWISIPQVIYPLLPPLLFASFTFVREFAVKKKRGDAYAV